MKLRRNVNGTLKGYKATCRNVFQEYRKHVKGVVGIYYNEDASMQEELESLVPSYVDTVYMADGSVSHHRFIFRLLSNYQFSLPKKVIPDEFLKEYKSTICEATKKPI